MKVSSIRGSRFLIVAIASMLAQVALAQGISGQWGSPLYKVQLSVTGATVSGTFTSLLAPDGASGTISGTLQKGREIFQAEWRQEMGAGHGGFRTLLALGNEGGVLVGYRWNEGGYPTSFALHRAVDGEIPQLIDVDKAGEPPLADTPRTPPAPAPARGQVLVCRSVKDGQPVGAGTAFEQLPEISLLHRYQGATAGEAEAAWSRDGVEIVRSVTHVKAGDGWVSFRLLSGDARLLPAGRYEVELAMPGRAPVRSAFNIKPTAVAGQTDVTAGQPAAQRPTTTPPPITQSGETLVLCRGAADGQPVGVATKFHGIRQLVALYSYQGRAAGNVEGIWYLNGQIVGRSRQAIKAGNGSAWFGYKREGGHELRPGTYRLTVNINGKTVLAQQAVVTSDEPVG